MGLLDQFNFDDPQTMGLLSAAANMLQASGPSRTPTSFGQVMGAGLQGGLSSYQGAQDRQQMQAMAQEKLKMLKLQEGRAQNLMKMQQEAFGGLGSGGQEDFSAAQGVLAPGAVGGIGPTIANAAAIPSQPQQAQAGQSAKLDQLRRFAIAGVPGAKELFDIYKYENEPQKLEQGATYVDRRTGSERSMPKLDNGISMSPDGSAGYVPGYAQSVAQQAGMTTAAQEAAKAQYNTTTLNLPSGPRMVSNAQLPGMLNGGGEWGAINEQTRAGQPQRDKGRLQILLDERAKATKPSDIAALDREIMRAGGGGRQPGIALQSDAEKEAQVGEVKTGVEVNRVRQLEAQANTTKTGRLYQQFGAALPQARELLKTATGSGVGSMADSALGFFGRATDSGKAADQLDTLGGWMTANVPRMEGPQSDRDVQAYKQMAATVGDRTKPAASRLAALDTLEALQNKYAAINGGQAAPSRAAAPSTQPGGKTMSLSDIAATARASGKSTAEVTKAARAAGYTIGGQ